MQIQENISLKDYSAMRLGGTARYFATAQNKEGLVQLVQWAKEKNVPIIVIGEGTNIIWNDEGFDGLVVVNKILGFETTYPDSTTLLVTIGAGEEWDDIVERCVHLGYGGIEQLSFIPGTAGATPVQNVGAYGREIKDVLVSVEAYDTKEDGFVTIPNSECQFSYRNSRFKSTDKGRFVIISITLKLKKEDPKPPFYDSLQAYLDEHHITDYTPSTIRQAVIAVRTKKLPDPDVIANNGSFFANPIISQARFAELQREFPDIISWPQDNEKIKVSAAWLIEQAGFKNFHDSETGMATWDKQSLVLINENAKSTQDLLLFKQKIVEAVRQKFSITLAQEPELI